MTSITQAAFDFMVARENAIYFTLGIAFAVVTRMAFRFIASRISFQITQSVSGMSKELFGRPCTRYSFRKEAVKEKR